LEDRLRLRPFGKDTSSASPRERPPFPSRRTGHGTRQASAAWDMLGVPCGDLSQAANGVATTMQPELRSEITCPHCGHRKVEDMPTALVHEQAGGGICPAGRVSADPNGGRHARASAQRTPRGRRGPRKGDQIVVRIRRHRRPRALSLEGVGSG
jgi:hypothetical protein